MKETTSVLLRTMTSLSVFSSGKYEYQKVKTVIDIAPGYIQYTYFNMSKITFTEDVLIAAGITEEYRIEKPGISKEMAHKFNIDRIQVMTVKEKKEHFAKKKKKNKIAAKLMMARHINDDRRILSKEGLKRMNNGNTHLDLRYREPIKGIIPPKTKNP